MSGMSMRGPDWMSVRGVDQRRLSEARLQAHYAVQWLARAARAFIPPQPDDEHTNLGWDGALDGFTTHPLKDGAWLSLKITDLTLALHVGEGRTHVQSFSLDSRSDAQARQWLRSEEHTSELQSPCNLVCRLLLEKKKKKILILFNKKKKKKNKKEKQK